MEVTNLNQCMAVLSAGTTNRATAVTGMHEHSSRSHAIVRIELQALRREKKQSGEAPSPTSKEQRELVRSKFNLVDLAGSERLKRTHAAGARLREGVNINHGLLTLGKVIAALVEREKQLSSSSSSSATSSLDTYSAAGVDGVSSGSYSSIHVPFRESKLTRLLQDSLGGNARTVMIACVSPSERDADETTNTLRYAARARQIRNKPTKNVTMDDSKAQIRKLQSQVAGLTRELGTSSARHAAAVQAAEDLSGETKTAAQQQQQQLVVRELEETLAAERAQHEVATAEWTAWRQEQTQKLSSLKTALRAEAQGAVDAEWTVRLRVRFHIIRNARI